MEIELTEKEMNKRIKFCKQMLRKNGEKIYNTFFSDEMGINLSEAHINKAWAPAGTRMEIEKPRKNVHLNCWGAISYFGATSLHIFKEPLKAGVYEGIIKSHLEEMDQIYPEGYYFQHDNSSVHKAAEKEATKMGLEILDFPTYSPDLSPIENLWSTLKSAVAADSPKTEAQLIRSLRRNWEKVTTENALKPYFEELEDRYLDCIECNGALLHC